jgi:hypothetical protein
MFKKVILVILFAVRREGEEEPHSAKFSVTSITKSNQTQLRTAKDNGLFFCGLAIGKKVPMDPPKPTETHQMPPKPTSRSIFSKNEQEHSELTGVIRLGRTVLFGVSVATLRH